jgi:uncharacterized membrane protein (UPF0127 family)
MNRSALALWIFSLLAACGSGSPLTVPVTVHGEGPVTFRAELADTRARQIRGLMFREGLAKDRGMLFVYKRPEQRSFWMFQTRIPLDILFIDGEKQILNIEEADSCQRIPCRHYLSRGRALYVLEINRGLSRQYGFRPGTGVEFSLP